ncbi:MAG: chloride channel protein [Candidatus Lambdaproteobacteria bacterium]|nr:chloride channel protein [Candidatus Lambdaproteobacteria bacterium]
MHRITAHETGVVMLWAVLVGLASGLSAIVLNLAVHNAIVVLEPWRGTWVMALLPALGGALTAAFIHYLLRDTAGHGVPELIRSVTVGGGAVRADLIYSRLVSSFLTVGSGGSAGLEGPIATSGGAIGSTLGRLLGFTERRRTLLLACGTAGAVAAIFNAPLTGTVFAVEVILGEWSALAIIPTVVAAVSATQFSRLVLGNQIAFPHEVFAFGTVDLLACVLLAGLTGLGSVGVQRLMRATEHAFARTRWPRWVNAGAGGLLVGLAGLAMPQVLHDGYDVVRQFLGGAPGWGLGFVLAFVLVKAAACCMTLGSGGSGGVFAPALVLGSGTGYGFGQLVRLALPFAATASPSAYSLVGMAGMVAGLMHAPLTGMFLVLEVTGGYRLILPLMIVSVLALLLTTYFEQGSIYTRELLEKNLLARRGSDQHLLQTMECREVVDAEDVVLHEDTLLGEFVERFAHARRNIFPVVDRETRRWLGIVNLDDIRPYLFDRTLYPLMTMGSVMDETLPTIGAQDSALSAIQVFEESGAWSLPVVEPDGRYVGMMSKSTLFDRYRRELIVHTAE